MSGMVERIARAITIADGDDPDVRTGSLLNENELWWHHRIPQALATLKAIREPTKEMKTAAHKVWRDHQEKRMAITGGLGSLPHSDWETHYWHAMADAALKEPEPTE